MKGWEDQEARKDDGVRFERRGMVFEGGMEVVKGVRGW